MEKLQNDILEVLVKTIYHAAYGSGDTLHQALNWEHYAVEKYQSDPKFHAIVNMQAALIINAVQDYESRHLSNRSSRAADSCPICGKPLIMGVCEAGCGYIPPPA